MSDQTTAPALTEHKGMRMARATDEDMKVGYELMALLYDMDRGYYPARPGDKSEGGPTHFDSDNHEHLEYLFQRIYEIADKSGSFGRIVGGMSVFLNPKNDIVDFNDHCIALSPSLKEAIKAKGLWEYYQAFVRTHGAESITELVVERDKFKAENDRLRGLLAEKVVDSTMLTGLEISSRGVDIGFEGGAARMLADMFVEQFQASGATNSLEVTFQDKELGQIVVTTQRMGGLTPAQQRGKAIAERDRLQSENNRLRAALERIEKWHGEFPDTGRQWDDGEAMSYMACFGSDGERDYMREAARLALLPAETPDHG